VLTMTAQKLELLHLLHPLSFLGFQLICQLISVLLDLIVALGARLAVPAAGARQVVSTERLGWR